jgi:transcriptional regulator with XRE-family HTH domain
MIEEIDLKGVGIRIKTEREKFGYIRDKFSEIVGISSVYLSQIERGERQMSLITLIKVATSLNLSLDYLIFGDEALDVNKEDLISQINNSSKKELKIFQDVLKSVLPHIKK